MGIAGVLISSSAGGLSIVISIVAIRRKLRRQKTNHQESSSEVFPISANAYSDTTSDRDAVFSTNCTDHLMATRSAGGVQQSSSETRASSDEHLTEESYVFHDSEIHKDHRLTKRIAAHDLLKHHGDNSVAETRQDTERSHSPLKEFTTQASDVACGNDHWEGSQDRFERSGGLSEDRAGVLDDSGSETESCSFGDYDCLSEEETETVRAGEHGKIMDSPLEMSSSTGQQASRGKRVSFQLEDYAGPHREFSNSVLDVGKPVAADIYTGRDMDGRDDVESLPENDGTVFETWVEADVSTCMIDDPDFQNERRLSMPHTAMNEAQNISTSVASRETNHPRVHFDNQNVSYVKKLSLVCVEPLAHVTALDVVTAVPSSLMPVVQDEHNIGMPAVSDAISVEDEGQWRCDEPENSKALLLANNSPQASHHAHDEEKENDASSAGSSTERLARQPRRGSERYGMFRRSSHPSLKRFRFSDRLKVRPLRSSGRNSN